jgi:hypothetical protein
MNRIEEKMKRGDKALRFSRKRTPGPGEVLIEHDLSATDFWSIRSEVASI